MANSFITCEGRQTLSVLGLSSVSAIDVVSAFMKIASSIMQQRQAARGKRQMQLWQQAAKTIKIQARGQPREATTIKATNNKTGRGGGAVASRGATTRGNKEYATTAAATTTTGQPQHGKHETETVTKTARQPHAREARAVAGCEWVCVHVCVATKLKALPVQRVERGKNLHAYLQTF